MEGLGIELDPEEGLGKGKVRPANKGPVDILNAVLGDGLGSSGQAPRPPEQIFEFTLGCAVPPCSMFDEGPDRPDSPATAPPNPRHKSGHFIKGAQPVPDSSLESRLDQPGCGRPEVDDRSHGRGDWYAVHPIGILRFEVFGFVHQKPTAGTIPTRHHNFDSVRPETGQIPEKCSGLMRGQGGFAAGGNGNHHVLFPARWATGDRQDSRGRSRKAPAFQEATHLVFGETNGAGLVE